MKSAEIRRRLCSWNFTIYSKTLRQQAVSNVLSVSVNNKSLRETWIENLVTAVCHWIQPGLSAAEVIHFNMASATRVQYKNMCRSSLVEIAIRFKREQIYLPRYMME
jgi:hypothetical protein